MTTWADLPLDRRHAGLVAIADLAQTLRAADQPTAADAVSAALVALQQEQATPQPDGPARSLEEMVRSLPPGVHARTRAPLLAVARALYMCWPSQLSQTSIVYELSHRGDWREQFAYRRDLKHSLKGWLENLEKWGWVESEKVGTGRMWRWRG